MKLNLSWFLLVVLICTGVPAVAAPGSPLSYPSPPEQNTPWTPPANTLPPAVVTATATLFAQGMADPRGCDYREIKIAEGSVWAWDGSSGAVTTHGWVLPANADAPTRYAVCWNGLVYQVASVGAPADLASDIDGIIRTDATARAQAPYSSVRSQREGTTYVAYATMAPIKTCLLLRAGRPDLAGRFWSAWQDGLQTARFKKAINAAPYGMLSAEWTSELSDRAECAHVYGNDPLALLSARSLTAILAKLNAETIGRMPVKEQRRWNEYYTQLPVLLADEERRCAELSYTHSEPIGSSFFTDDAPLTPEQRSHRVAELILALEDISIVSEPNVFRGDLPTAPPVKALISIGDTAVEPLLDTLVNDDRLTRSLSFGKLVSVRSVAVIALEGILQTSFNAPYDLDERPEARKQLAAEIRAHWLSYRGLTGPALWYSTLRDNGAPPEQWRIAATHIVHPSKWQPGAESRLTDGINWNDLLVPSEAPDLFGESLRSRTHPSVSELLLKRAEQRTPLGDATFAHALALWDGNRHLTALRHFTRQLQNASRTDAATGDPYKVGDITDLYLQRIDLHDPAAIPDYAAWLGTITLPTEGFRMFEPAYAHADDPTIEKRIRAMFAAPNSPWALTYGKAPKIRLNTKADNLGAMIDTVLIAQPGFRDFLLANLQNQTVAGTAKVEPDGNITNFSREDWADWQSGSYNSNIDPLLPKPGTAVPYRVCDLIASAVGDIEGAPECELYWPLARRNAAVAQCAAFLRRYSGQMRFDPKLRSFWPFGETEPYEAHLIFPPLNRPATQADVNAGHAIFALSGRRRFVALSAVPVKATWIARNDAMMQHARKSPRSGEAEQVVGILKDGYVWQAEDVWQNGRWQRWYGFVGMNALVKLPASALQLEKTRR